MIHALRTLTRFQLADVLITFCVPLLIAASAFDVVWGEWHPMAKPAAFVVIAVIHPLLWLVWIGCAVDVWRRWGR